MFIRALRTTFGDYGRVRKGDIVEVADPTGQQLVRRGLFEGVQMKEGKGESVPLSNPGGRSGKARPSSSSPAAPARKTPQSKKPEEDAGQSPSTVRGGSAHGQTSSTPATSHGGNRPAAFLSSGD